MLKSTRNNAAAGPGPVLPHGMPRGTMCGRQRGVVLLALVLVVLVGSSYVLLGKLNERARDYARNVQTQAALKQAKQALLQYAVNYPELHEDSDRIAGPGYLPCPDQNDGPDQGDGIQDDGQVGQSNCSEVTGTTLGRLPTRDLGLDDLRDAAGERLWYAVSHEFKQNQVSTHVLNSETRATLGVDATSDIVAVIIAPGEPISGQDGRGTAQAAVLANSKDWYEVADEFLEDGNGNATTTPDVAYVTASTVADSAPQCTDGSLDDDELAIQCFNDQLITITRQELMAAVEARVANEVRGVLASFRSSAGGAFPWLAPFTDPKRAGRYAASAGGYGLAGRHTSATASATDLSDAYADFVLSGVAAGDVIWNVTDGSFGTISAVTATSVTVGSLSGGGDNTFQQYDAYYIDAAAPDIATRFDGLAAAGSGGTTLDAGVDLEQFGVVPGDVIDNLTDGTSGVVTTVDGDEMDVDSASGVEFDPNDAWRVRSALGLASAGSAGTTLVDQDVDFPAAGVQVGDLVRNLADGSQGIVSAVGVPDDQTLAVGALYGGTANAFAVGNSYALSRHLPVTGTRFGLLPVHESGKPFDTEFSVKWSMTSANGNTVTVSAPGAATTYTTALTNWIQSSTSYSDSTGIDGTYPDAVVADSEVACVWIAVSIADCSGKYVDGDFLKAAVESVTQSGAIYSITDTGTRFNYAGVRPGARIRNPDQPSLGEGIVYGASSSTQNLVRAVAVDDGGTPFSVVAGESVQVLVASKRSPATGGYIADGATGPNQACYTGANFSSFLEPGDTIRLNSSTYGSPVGRIETVSADCVTHTDLQGGTATSIAIDQSFRVLYDFVEERQWEFKVRMAGTGVEDANVSAGRRLRSVCQGFDSDCASLYAEALFSPETLPVVSFTDYDAAATVLGSASVAIPAAGAGQGSLLVGGMDFLIAGDADSDTDDGFLPRWFLPNRWHEYLFVSYAEALTPTEVAIDPASDCVTGTDCLSVNVSLPAGAIRNDRKAVVLVAGAELAGQNRITGDLDEYFEDENADTDTDALFEHMVFERADVDDTFNDQLSAVVTD